MAHLVSKAELDYRSRAVAAADDCCSVCLCKSLCYCDRTCRECGVLKYAHWSVPNNGLCALNSVCKELLSLCSDVKAFHVCGDCVNVYNLNVDRSVDGVREVGSDSCVNGEKKLFAELLSLGDHLLAVVELAVVNERLADLFALSLEEGVCHAAADDESVALLEEVGDNVELVCNLCAAEDSNEGTYGSFNSVAQVVDFLLHEVTNGCVLDVVCNARC